MRRPYGPAPLDNAVSEALDSTVEFELRANHFATREQARRTVAAWIDEYNTVRPVDYERSRAQAHPTAPDREAA